MTSGVELAPTAVEADVIAFRLTDPGHDLGAVRLWTDLDLGADLDLAPVGGGWELRLPHPEVECLEYMFDLGGDLMTDPGNPVLVDGAFGAHSWLDLPGYAPPAWLDLEPAPSVLAGLRVRRTPVDDVDVAVWSPADTGGPLPLLLAHDGPEMDRFGRLTRYAAALIGAGALPAFRVALLSPGDRNARYAASPDYATALVEHVLPAVTRRFATRGLPVLTGQSLGGLAALHAATSHPGALAGLLLQSGSFFTAELDDQERGFSHWTAVTDYVSGLDASPGCPVTITCGTAEENYGNNRLMAQTLSSRGVDVAWGEVRQGHTWTCWRDLLDPHLTDLLRRVW